jgi:tripartite-type tricarboxylate transporter receptor subunit TctC
MKLPRRQFLHLAMGAAVAPAFSRSAAAESYPSRPITMIVPFPAGGGLDVVARILAERMKESLGQPIMIENVSGAGGSIGTGRVALAKPDGYTIQIGYTSTHVLNGAFYSLPYDILNDFEPILPVATSPSVLFARKAMPANNFNELIAWLKVNRAAAGIFSPLGNLVFAMLQKEIGTQLTLVPYRGGAPALQDLVAGQIDMYFDSPVPLPLVRAGSIKAYAVTGDTRLMAAPDAPTFAEVGLPALSYSFWYGFFAPRDTSKHIIGKLNAAAAGALADPVARSRIADLGMDVVPRERQTPEALAALVKADAAKWWPLIKEFGIKAE